jgi:hypothetical protein
MAVLLGRNPHISPQTRRGHKGKSERFCRKRQNAVAPFIFIFSHLEIARIGERGYDWRKWTIVFPIHQAKPKGGLSHVDHLGSRSEVL